MITLHELFATELRLLEPLCTIVRTDDFTVYRSERFPGFYGGNAIHILRNGGRTLGDWERLFDDYFDRARYGHRTFLFLKNDACRPLEEQARAAGYDKVQTATFMAAPPGAPDGLHPQVRRMQTDEEWAQYRRFYHETNNGENWYTPGGCDRLFDKMFYQTQAIDIHWLYLPGGAEIPVGAVIGVFVHNGIARLQDVETHPACRRRGLASVLLRHIMAYAGAVLGAHTVALCADNDYFAYGFYRRAGFVPVGESVEMMRYPV